MKIRATMLSILFAIAAEAQAAPAGGLDKVNDFMDNVLSILNGVSLTVVTIAIMWAGYKYLFKHADIGECAKILAGGLLIGGAGQLATYLLS
ncbi:MAG: TrbC/VirB2 family protein [Candidatus Accumulibacter sp.]|jgi:type IV secretion system protein VirB2/type IV secretion system protein PtlA|nr:TrbC/VirB2 family protein [Accumulibacter sp.]